MDFVALAQECAPWVAYETMAAIVKTESAFQPLVIGINGGVRLVRQPESKAEAVITAKWLIGNGYNIDMGLGQINAANLMKTGLTVEDAFDPCKNLAASASILFWNYQAAKRTETNEQAALRAALSAYNTGSFSKGFANGYVQKVVNNADVKLAVPAIQPIPVSQGQAQQPRPINGQGRAQTDDCQPRMDSGASVYASGNASVYSGCGATKNNVMVY